MVQLYLHSPPVFIAWSIIQQRYKITFFLTVSAVRERQILQCMECFPYRASTHKASCVCTCVPTCWTPRNVFFVLGSKERQGVKLHTKNAHVWANVEGPIHNVVTGCRGALQAGTRRESSCYKDSESLWEMWTKRSEIFIASVGNRTPIHHSSSPSHYTPIRCSGNSVVHKGSVSYIRFCKSSIYPVP
jgi:hypothetical protein